MKKVIWFTGIFVLTFILIVGCYLFFSYEKSNKMPEGTFVKLETDETLRVGFDIENNGVGNDRIKKYCTKNDCPVPRLTQTERTWHTWQRSA